MRRVNGAEIRFDEAYNVAAYALLNGGALDPNSADIFVARFLVLTPPLPR